MMLVLSAEVSKLVDAAVDTSSLAILTAGLSVVKVTTSDNFKTSDVASVVLRDMVALSEAISSVVVFDNEG